MATEKYPLRTINFKAVALMTLLLSLAKTVNAQSITMPASLDSIASGAQAGFASLSTTGTTPSISCPVGTCGTTIRVTVRTSSSGIARVRLSTTTGLTAPTGYASADWTSGSASEIAFEGVEANVNAALATLAYTGGQGSISASLSQTGIAYYSVTGNYYKYVTTPLNWLNAKNDAESAGQRFFGATGYLTTITSAGEFDFVKNKMGIGAGVQLWLGGTRCPAPYVIPGCANNASGNNDWKWVGGPETGDVFFQGSNGGTTPAGKYSAWSGGEPNGSGGAGEGYLQVTNSGLWNDLNGNSSLAYVIEYTGSGLATNASTSVSGPVLVPVLSPIMMALFASLMVGIGLFFQRRRRIHS